MSGRGRARFLAGRYGRALKECRCALGHSQAAAADRAGVSQSFWSALERGNGTVASLETLAACAAAVGAQLLAFIEARPGAELPRDIEHLRRQELVIRLATRGGWAARPERSIDPGWSRSRSIDLLLERTMHGRRELAVVEIEDWLADIGAAMRGLSDKGAALRREATDAVASGLLVIRRTSRNRGLVRELEHVMAARFPADPSAWLRALADPARQMPQRDGWLWSSMSGDRLLAPRLRRVSPPRAPGA